MKIECHFARISALEPGACDSKEGKQCEQLREL